MVSYKNYVAGWVDSSIDDYLADLPNAFPSVRYALITCLDSDLHPAALLKSSPGLRAAQESLRPVGKGLLLPTSVLLSDDLYREIFFGFDEVWFFPEAIDQPKPIDAWLVGPARIDQAKMDRLGDWMTRNACSLALGDGAGLNLIVKAHGLIRNLLAHTLEKANSDSSDNSFVLPEIGKP